MQDATQPLPTSTADKCAPISDNTDLTGRTLGDFRIIRCLGQGGMGKVYLAEQSSLKRKVALKFLRADLAASSTALRRFRAEAEAVARVTHANIVQVYAIGETDGLNYMALEYVEGRNLREYLNRKGSPELPVALTIMRQVAAALQKASESGIVHRDIKPENILLTRKGEVKVADFGLSRVFGGEEEVHLTQTGMTLGTPLYMSPEQVQGKPLDPRSDIYSFGVTCYQMLAGRTPFSGANAFEVALQHVQNKPQPLEQIRPDMPAELCALIHRMMSKEPESRPQTGREILRELSTARLPVEDNGFANGSPDLPPTSVRMQGVGDATEPEVASSPTKSRRFGPREAALVGVSIALALAAGVGLRLWANSRAQALSASGYNDHPALPIVDERERQLQAAVDIYAAPTRQDQLRVGADHHVQLGVLYLEQQRYDEAEKLFESMIKRTGSPDPYKKIGHIGLAITYAMLDEYDQSIKQFMDLRTPNAKAPGFRPILPPSILPPESLINLRFWMLTAIERDATHMSLPPVLNTLREELKKQWPFPKGKGG